MSLFNDVVCSSCIVKVSADLFFKILLSGLATSVKFAMKRWYTLHNPKKDIICAFVAGVLYFVKDLTVLSILSCDDLIMCSKYSNCFLKK